MYDAQFDDDIDPNEPLAADLDDDDRAPVIQCPSCGGDVFEDAEQCPNCGEWIVHSRAARPRHWVWIAAAVLAAAALIVLSVT